MAKPEIIQDIINIETGATALANVELTGTAVLPYNTTIGDVQNWEINYLTGVVGSIQDQFDAKASLASPVFTGTMGVTAQQDVSGVLSSKVGSGTMSGTSLTVTDSFITASTYVSIYPLGTKAGTWTVNSASGSFTITSTKSETSCAFKWEAIK